MISVLFKIQHSAEGNIANEPSGQREPSSGQISWPLLYVLPQFPTTLKKYLEEHRERVKADKPTTNRLARILKENMERLFVSSYILLIY